MTETDETTFHPLFSQVLDLWIKPEFKRRQEVDPSSPKTIELLAAQITWIYLIFEHRGPRLPGRVASAGIGGGLYRTYPTRHEQYPWILQHEKAGRAGGEPGGGVLFLPRTVASRGLEPLPGRSGMAVQSGIRILAQAGQVGRGPCAPAAWAEDSGRARGLGQCRTGRQQPGPIGGGARRSGGGREIGQAIH